MTEVYSLGLGIGTQNSQGQWLEVYYPSPVLKPDTATAQAVSQVMNYSGGNEAVTLSADATVALADALEKAGNQEQAAIASRMYHSKRPLVATLLATDTAPSSVPEAYLKLHLLSHRLVKPHDTELASLYEVLPNVAWTNAGAIDLSELPERQLQACLAGEPLNVYSVDKFPKMTNYVVPTGVRIAHTARVRLGAYLGEGTTIMHEGFVNFNAGTEGPSMVEGRISAGVFVGEGSDLGGSSSTMGTLSGGGNLKVSLGKSCLLGANAGTGIPLGDRCTVESGLYITAGTKVTLLDEQEQEAGVVKARELAGKNDLLFRRNSLSGRIECLTNQSSVQLNTMLHLN